MALGGWDGWGLLVYQPVDGRSSVDDNSRRVRWWKNCLASNIRRCEQASSLGVTEAALGPAPAGAQELRLAPL